MTDTETPDKTQKVDAELKAQLFNVPQIAGGALAAVTAAALGSQLGVAGTLAGAAVASVVAAVASTLYTRGLEQTRDGVKKVVLREGNGQSEVITVVEDEASAGTAGTASSALHAKKRSKWTQHPVALVAGMVLTAAVTFVVAMGVITGWEFTSGTTLSGKPGTTVGQASQPSTKPTPSASSTPSATPSSTPTATPTPTPTETASSTPSATPSGTPTPAATASGTEAGAVPTGAVASE